jgi:hypothetical protein
LNVAKKETAEEIHLRRKRRGESQLFGKHVHLKLGLHFRNVVTEGLLVKLGVSALRLGIAEEGEVTQRLLGRWVTEGEVC